MNNRVILSRRFSKKVRSEAVSFQIGLNPTVAKKADATVPAIEHKTAHLTVTEVINDTADYVPKAQFMTLVSEKNSADARIAALLKEGQKLMNEKHALLKDGQKFMNEHNKLKSEKDSLYQEYLLQGETLDVLRKECFRKEQTAEYQFGILKARYYYSLGNKNKKWTTKMTKTHFMQNIFFPPWKEYIFFQIKRGKTRCPFVHFFIPPQLR